MPPELLRHHLRINKLGAKQTVLGLPFTSGIGALFDLNVRLFCLAVSVVSA